MASELVRVRALEARRDGFVLSIADWRLNPGEVVGLVGPNGAGKTTLLQSLAGLRPAREDELRVLGATPGRTPRGPLAARLHDRRHAVAAAPGAIAAQMLSGYYPTWDRELVEVLVERFKIDPRDKVHKLSKGQGTRLRLITAMAFRPRVLLLDEPATGLDVAGRRALLESVLEVVHDPERSVVVSSHMLADVERIADRLLVLDGAGW